MEVGVRELKAKLSDYLERVASGQVLTVTLRGRPVAQLVPVAGAALERGLAEGWLVRDREAPPEAVTPWPPRPGSPTPQGALDEDRGE